MTPRAGALALALALFAAPLAAEAQPAVKVYRIGVLANAFDIADGPVFQVFLDGMGKLGYVEEQNMIIEWRSSEGRFDRLPALAAELVRAKVDLILATSLLPGRAAADATKTIPIVFVVAADPVGHGLVGNLARPGGNVTGLATYMPEEISERMLQLLREAAPNVSRLAVLTNPVNPVHKELMTQALPIAAQRFNVSLLSLEMRSASDLPGAFDAAVRERADAVYVLGDAIFYIHRALIAGLGAKHRLPVVYTFRGGAEAGGLMSYGPDLRDLFRRATIYVDRILKGARPGELPVEQPAKFELALNLKTARALGLTIPPALLRRANAVIQ
jgi:putative tryptophan/tyrosine transport system substrate-binding protein